MGSSGTGPRRARRVHEHVAEELRRSILSGELMEGQRLPPEPDLIERFDVSRTAVRQAMQRLEQQGLVDVRVGSGGGCFVARIRLDPVRESFTNVLALRGIEVDEFLSAKAEIEPTIFAAAAATIRAEELRVLERNLASCARALEAGDDDRVFVLAHEFHRVVGAATRNRVLQLVLESLVDVAGLVPRFRGPPAGGWDGVLQDHTEILAALGAGDAAQVRRVGRQHADSVRAAFLRSTTTRGPVPVGGSEDGHGEPRPEWSRL